MRMHRHVTSVILIRIVQANIAAQTWWCRLLSVAAMADPLSAAESSPLPLCYYYLTDVAGQEGKKGTKVWRPAKPGGEHLWEIYRFSEVTHIVVGMQTYTNDVMIGAPGSSICFMKRCAILL
jgi:hypothetical protein